jgi:ribonuclease HII
LGALDDSKRLSPEVREEVAARLRPKAIWCLGIASVEEIDRFNILRATFMAMRRAFEGLTLQSGLQPMHAIIDGNQKPGLPCTETTLVEGDHLSYSIAAASILAKVARDKMMRDLALEHSRYGWEHNMGYGTREHLAAIDTHGLTPHHRTSFRPVYEQLSLID